MNSKTNLKQKLIDPIIENLIVETISPQSISTEIKKTFSELEKPVQLKKDLNHQISWLLETIKKKTGDFNNQVQIRNVGTVQQIGNGVAKISGLPQIGINELVQFSSGCKGLVLYLESDSIDVILLGSEEGIHGGDMVTSSREIINVPVGPALTGRIFNALGEPLDDLPPIKALDYHNVEVEAPMIIERSPVNEPLHTGIKVIDALFPIGRGQRELIVGDRQTGKTALAVDTILSQKNCGVICFYVSIGQKKSSVLSVIDTLKKKDALAYTSVLIASPDDPPALRYLAPFSAYTMAEYFLNQGQDILIVFDDLSKHADSYREISLLLRRPPGREAYPGDIFYLHSRLLERSCKLNDAEGGGSITALPIITMQQGNISSFIPTNLISICDGQIVLSTSKFNKGFKPAVNIGLSVSRVGGAAQSKAMRSVANELKINLSQYEEVERFTRFGTDVDKTTRLQIQRGQRLQILLNQPDGSPLPLSNEVVIIFAATRGYLDEIEIEKVEIYENYLLNWFRKNHEGFLQDIDRSQQLDLDAENQLHVILAEFNLLFNSGEIFNE